MSESKTTIFGQAKEAFLDRIDPEQFIRLECNIPLLEKLHDLKEAQFKIALLRGEPGIGKTMLLSKFAQESDVLFFHTPFFKIEEFEQALKDALRLPQEIPLVKGLESLEPYTKMVILDEAQLYEKNFLEYIRILSDSEKLKFLLSFHTIDQENPLAQQHFQSRIFTTLSLFPPLVSELHIYIQKRLFMIGLSELSQNFSLKETKFIYSFTKGNFRQTNKFLYTLFDILEYFEKNYPTKVDTTKVTKKYLQMCAIYMGYIDA